MMRCLIIDHDTKFINELKEFFSEHNPIVVNHKDFKKDSAKPFDFVVLSGGPIHISDEEDLVEEKAFIRTTDKPILAICLGLQILGATYGSKLLEMESKRRGRFEIDFFGKRGKIFQSHSWLIKDVPEGFNLISRTGDIIEVMQHNTRPILAVQGHPENSGEFGKYIKETFIEKFMKDKSQNI